MQLTTIPQLPPLHHAVDHFARAAGTLTSLDAAIASGERTNRVLGGLWNSATTDIYDGYKLLRATHAMSDDLEDLAQSWGWNLRLSTKLFAASEELSEGAALGMRHTIRDLHPLLQAGSDAIRATMQPAPTA
jgi:hypothetical protein